MTMNVIAVSFGKSVAQVDWFCWKKKERLCIIRQMNCMNSRSDCAMMTASWRILFFYRQSFSVHPQDGESPCTVFLDAIFSRPYVLT